MRTLNLGVLAHVDAGKTSLTERLLYAAGVIDHVGHVDDGDTQTDTLALERARGITIKSAVASFVVDDVAVNLIDTPGHPDFIAEVERVLSVLDGAVLVISAVEGVQAQTRILMRALQRLRIPTLLFVNKIDRAGARYDGVLAAIAARLTPAIVAMGAVANLGERAAAFRPYGATEGPFVAALAERLAENDEAIMAAYVDDAGSLGYPVLRDALASQSRRALAHPVFFGSAITGAGVAALMADITTLLPATPGNVDGPASGVVFKVERGPSGERIAFVRMFAGTVRTRDRLHLRGEEDRKVTAISVFDRGSAAPSDSVSAGQIGKLWGLGDIQIGDAIGEPRANVARHRFAPPTLETVVAPRHEADRSALHTALAQLAEQDPLINLRQDDVRQEMFVSLYGEVQKEVIQATLAADFGLEAEFRETHPICIERPIGVGASVEYPPRPFIAAVGLRVEPGPIDSGVAFRLEVEFGSLPLAFFTAVEDSARETLQQGLYGWRVTDCIVSMTHAIRFRHWATSTPAEHRNLTPLVLMAALKQAGTQVLAPMHRFHLEVPADTLALVSSLLAKLGAAPHPPAMRGGVYEMDGAIPAGRVHALQLALPALTRGEGVLETEFDHYEPVQGPIPVRPRSDHNPLDRKIYLQHVLRRG
jgi:ribosomal protection tetracycline resistance protein